MPKTEQGLSFSRNKTYYRQPTHEFNIPSGWSCPGAHNCLTKVDKDTGKRTQAGPEYVCYAAGAERYPNVRAQRWENYRIARELAKDPNAVIHLPKTQPTYVSTPPATSSTPTTSAYGYAPRKPTPAYSSGLSPSPSTT